MSRWFVNQGWNRNLLVLLSGGPVFYQMDVYLLARFQFFHSGDGTVDWTMDEVQQWKTRFMQLIYQTWSEKWLLLSDISCEPVDPERARISIPNCRVRVHAVDIDNPAIRMPSNQRVYAIRIYRIGPTEVRQRQHAATDSSMSRVSDMTPASSDLPRGTATAEIYEDSIELSPPSEDQNQQYVATHEFGHMLGLRHPNDWEEGCQVDHNAAICYGQLYSPDSASIMGRGQELRREDYRVFLHIISRLLPTTLSSGLAGATGFAAACTGASRELAASGATVSMLAERV